MFTKFPKDLDEEFRGVNTHLKFQFAPCDVIAYMRSRGVDDRDIEVISDFAWEHFRANRCTCEAATEWPLYESFIASMCDLVGVEPEPTRSLREECLRQVALLPGKWVPREGGGYGVECDRPRYNSATGHSRHLPSPYNISDKL